MANKMMLRRGAPHDEDAPRHSKVMRRRIALPNHLVRNAAARH